jgi:hypothetical protein
MAPDRDAALEPEQQVLPYRLDAFEPATVDRSGDACQQSSRVRRRGGDDVADERTETRGHAVK